MTDTKRTALDWIEANRSTLSEAHMKIWYFAESAWREYRSCAWYVEQLRAEGFQVEEGSAGMPTAFCATWGEEGPVLGGYAEYDAVPGRSQDPVPYKKPREGHAAYAAGHTDPHSGLGIGAFAGFIAAKHAFVKHGIKARIKFFGEPAEKMCGSKPVHAAHGYFDDLDVAISFHPSSFPDLANTCFWDTACLSYWSKIYTFRCDDPEGWVASRALTGVASGHAANRAPGTLDAVCLMYTTAKQMKESMLPRAGGWTLNEHVLVAGQATSDNLPPNIGQIQYSCRAPAIDMMGPVFAVLDHTAEHVAAMTQCTLEGDWVTKTRVGLPNHAMAELTFGNFELVGAPAWGEEARIFAREIQKNLGLEPMENPFQPAMEVLTAPDVGEEKFRKELPPWQFHYGADDYVDYTWHAPTVRLYVARPRLQEPDPGYKYPEWTRYAMGGVPAMIDPMWHKAGQVIATTLVDLASEPELIAAAKAEFDERTGGGVGGDKWIAPLLPADFEAPVDFAWPEYVDTPRGPEWTLRKP
jgi:aminobenzoyl-glutamate utilization protein B